MPWSHAPSAEWPPGSRVEHLYEAGLWVGAIKNGTPAVSTASFEYEFRPTSSPLDTIYRTYEGAPGGSRLPSSTADDDMDGIRDEDWLDGHDNDLDGSTDEDFAAISDQMFSCWYTDNQPEASQDYPEHSPLDIMVRQETYQWSTTGFDQFVGIEYTITNIGMDPLENIYIGLSGDLDVGSRDSANYWEDDGGGYWQSPAVCTNQGPVALDFAYGYDIDGDGGLSPGYIGMMFLGHPVDPTGLTAPREVGIRTFANFDGSVYSDPTNDFERYTVLASESIQRNSTVPRDYRTLIATGPFAELLPGSTLVIQAAFAVGAGLSGLINSAVSAKLTYEGKWFDLDGDPMTGTDRREEPVYGPGVWVIIDSCRTELSTPVYLAGRGPIWINRDCAREEFFKTECAYAEADSFLFRTGVGGKETVIRWIAGDEVPVPAAITAFHAVAVNSAIELRWEIYTPDDVIGFLVYRQEAGGSIFESLTPGRLIDARERNFVDSNIRAGQTYNYLLGLIRGDNSELRSDRVTITTPSLSLELHPNYPNPFNPSTTVSFTLPQATRVNLSIFDLEGRLVNTLLEKNLPEGFKQIQWDGTNSEGTTVASGTYFVRLQAGHQTLTRKVILLK